MTTLHRIAILWDLDGPGASVPVGVALEYSDEVLVTLPSRYRWPRYYREPIRRGSVNAPEVEEWRPGHPEYFDLVVEDLQRTFAVTMTSTYAPAALTQREDGADAAS